MTAMGRLRQLTAGLVDRVLETSIVGSFTRLGFVARRQLETWGPDADATGQVIVITGATSGLGLAAARRWTASGATVEVVVRDADKARALADSLGVGVTLGDVGDLDDMTRVAEALRARHGRIDALVHNAGALDLGYTTTRQGNERTLATHVLGPLRLTAGLLPSLGRGARVIWVSSGGMYAEPLDVDRLEMAAGDYDGMRAYARAKRAQVTLAELLAERLSGRQVAVHAMHPGWADTPGVARSLPRFRAWIGRALRTSDEGADTFVWLATAPGEALGTGRFWLDRHPRTTHLRRTTRRADTPDARSRLWRWVTARAGLSPDWPDTPA